MIRVRRVRLGRFRDLKPVFCDQVVENTPPKHGLELGLG